MFSLRSAVDRRPNRLAQVVARLRESGVGLLDLTGGNPTQAEIGYPERELLAALADPAAQQYRPEPFGLPAARGAVADGLGVDPGRVVLTASTSEAYAFLLKLLCDPGDQVLVPRPSYPLFEHLARAEAVELVPYWLRYDDGAWSIDLADVRRRLQPRVRAIVTVSPNNPTGNFLKHDELAALSALGLPLVSDEVFASYPLGEDPNRAPTALQATGVLVFALGGLSKLAGLPQLKLAWITVGGPDPSVREALARLELIADTYLSVGTPVQLALPTLLRISRPTHRAIADRCRRNLAELRQSSAGTLLTPLHVEGGWYAPVRLPRLRSEDEWLHLLLEREHVLTQPGWFYDFADEPVLILSLLTPEGVFREGLERLHRTVAAAG